MHDIASYNWCIIRTEPIITLSPFPHSHSSSRVREELIAGIPAKRAILAVAAPKSHFVAWLKRRQIISFSGLTLVPSALQGRLVFLFTHPI